MGLAAHTCALGRRAVRTVVVGLLVIAASTTVSPIAQPEWSES